MSFFQGVLLAWLGGVLAALSYGICQFQVASENTVAHNLGRASGYLGLLLRDPLRGVVVIIAVVLALLALAALEFGDHDSGPDNRPPVTPLQAANLRMSTMYPFERRRVVAPPFIGHRFPLGDRP